MANFFYAVVVYADGHKENFEGRLWLLGGYRDEEGYALLQSLKDKHKSGEIVDLRISYES